MTRRPAVLLLALLAVPVLAGSPEVPDQAGLAERLSARSLKALDFKPVVNLPPGAEAALLEEDPATHGIEALVRFPKGYRVPPHWHRHAETLVVVQGTLRLTVAGTQARHKAGAVVRLPPGLIHELATGRLRGCLFLVRTDRPFDFFYVDPDDRLR